MVYAAISGPSYFGHADDQIQVDMSGASPPGGSDGLLSEFVKYVFDQFNKNVDSGTCTTLNGPFFDDFISAGSTYNNGHIGVQAVDTNIGVMNVGGVNFAAGFSQTGFDYSILINSPDTTQGFYDHRPVFVGFYDTGSFSGCGAGGDYYTGPKIGFELAENGYRFSGSPSRPSNGNWLAVTRSASACSNPAAVNVIPTGKTLNVPSGFWYELRIKKDVDSDVVQFFINGESVANSSTAIPTANALTFGIVMDPTSNNLANVNVDYVKGQDQICGLNLPKYTVAPSLNCNVVLANTHNPLGPTASSNWKNASIAGTSCITDTRGCVLKQELLKGTDGSVISTYNYQFKQQTNGNWNSAFQGDKGYKNGDAANTDIIQSRSNGNLRLRDDQGTERDQNYVSYLDNVMSTDMKVSICTYQ